MPELVDQKERHAIRTELGCNLIVEAAAGTGKTTELVRRIVEVLKTGHSSVESIVAVTFTEKAAGELKLRIREEIEAARGNLIDGSAERRSLDDALARLEEARVGTIHAFCADLLHERSIEAGVDPQFEMLNESSAQRLYAQAFQLWLQEKLAAPPEGVRRSLRRKSQPRGASRWAQVVSPSAPTPEGDPVARLRQAGWTLAQWRDFPARWSRRPFARQDRIDELVEATHELAKRSAQCHRPKRDGFYQDTESVRRLSENIATAEAVGPRDYDQLEAYLVELAQDRKFMNGRRGSGRDYGPGTTRKEIQEQREVYWGNLEQFLTDADADLAACLQTELEETVQRYEVLKQRTGKLDFVDLLLRTRDLLRDHAAIRRDFQRRFKHLLVDEFQDTDPLQAEILLLLSAEDPETNDWHQIKPADGKLFLVADPKQSIYRFRRADIGTYLEIKQQLMRHGALFVQLTTSFRSVPSIQNAVNTAFAPYMRIDSVVQQVDYAPLSPSRDDFPEQPAVVALPVPEPYGKSRITIDAINASLPDAVGAFVHWLIHESNWSVSTRQSPNGRAPISAQDICILFRRFDAFFSGDITRPYVQALEARDVRHLLVGGRSFHDREEVETLRTALTAIEWPDDELAVFATLRGPLFAIGDEELLEYRHVHGHWHPFRLAEGNPHSRLRPVFEALILLADLHRQRNRRPIAETVNTLLEVTRAHASFVFWPSGDQVLANVLHVADQARAYEASGGISFRGFIDRLRDDAEARRDSDAPIVEEGSDGVRLMTVHRAKGLEFPIVILADPTAPLIRGRADRHIDPVNELCAVRIAGWSPHELLEHQEVEKQRDRAEGVRLAYVAATRARDLLVVPTIGDEVYGGGATEKIEDLERWFSPLNRALYPPKKRWNQPEPPKACPPFGNDSVVTRPAESLFTPVCVHPGAHAMPHPLEGPQPSKDGPAAFRERRYQVVWWDPHVLQRDARPVFGLQQESLIQKGVDAELVEQDLKRFRDWNEGRQSVLEKASAPSKVVETVLQRATALVANLDARNVSLPHVETVALPVDEDRPSGPRFGALLHAGMAHVELGDGPQVIRQVCETQGRILDASDAEVEAACSAIEAALRSPVMAKVREAERVEREVPVSYVEEDGSFIEGVVDMAFLLDNVWHVVDFKSASELRASLPLYRFQVDLYREAISRATGLPATAMILRI